MDVNWIEGLKGKKTEKYLTALEYLLWLHNKIRIHIQMLLFFF